MNINSKVASVAAVSAIVGVTFVGANSVSALRGDGDKLVDKIVEQYDASEADAQTFVDGLKAEFEANREANRDEHLSGLVESGVLSEEQRAELEAFGEDRREQIAELKAQDLSREEIKEAMEGLRDEVEACAEAEGIDLDEIKPDKGDREDRKERRQERRSDIRDRIEAEFGQE